MKAKIKYRVNIEKHVELGTVVPLKTPYVLLVDPSSLCNFKCKFCPSGNIQLIQNTGRYQGLLDFDLFKKIINDLEEFEEPIRVLRLYKEGEPLINKKFSQMISYAKQSGFVKRVDTTTNGLLLNPKLNKDIIEAGLDQINISVNGVSSEQIKYYTGANVDFDKYVKNIKDLYENRGNCEISIKSIKENLTNDEQKRFFDIFGEISNRIVLENLSPAWPQFEFDQIKMQFESGNYGQEIIERKVCPYIFYIMVVNADGKTSLCVGDWKHCLGYGDLKKQSVKKLWNNEIITKHRLAHLKGMRAQNEFCATCQVVSHGTIDNLDPYIDEILKRI